MTIQIRSARDKYARENESSRNDRVHSHVQEEGGGGGEWNVNEIYGGCKEKFIVFLARFLEQAIPLIVLFIAPC